MSKPRLKREPPSYAVRDRETGMFLLLGPENARTGLHPRDWVIHPENASRWPEDEPAEDALEECCGQDADENRRYEVVDVANRLQIHYSRNGRLGERFDLDYGADGFLVEGHDYGQVGFHIHDGGRIHVSAINHQVAVVHVDGGGVTIQILRRGEALGEEHGEE